MIAFGACVADEEKFRTCAARGIGLVAEPDAIVAETSSTSSIFEAYNEILDAVAPMEQLEALVLLHEDAEIIDPQFCTRLRGQLADPQVAIVGVVGAVGIRHLGWWQFERRGRVTETRWRLDYGGGTHDVDGVDGLLLALSPWAVRNLRFDAERFTGFHGYDLDLCFQARAAGRRVVVADLPVVHHTKGGVGDKTAFLRANAIFRSKWRPGSLDDISSAAA